MDEAKTGISRDKFLDAMTYHNIGVGVHSLSLPEQIYQNIWSWQSKDYPNAMNLSRQSVSVSLPTSSQLTNEDVIEAIHQIATI